MLKTLHGFTEKVIAERKQELKEKLKVVKQDEQEEVNKMIMMRIFVDMIFALTRKKQKYISTIATSLTPPPPPNHPGNNRQKAATCLPRPSCGGEQGRYCPL